MSNLIEAAKLLGKLAELAEKDESVKGFIANSGLLEKEMNNDDTQGNNGAASTKEIDEIVSRFWDSKFD